MPPVAWVSDYQVDLLYRTRSAVFIEVQRQVGTVVAEGVEIVDLTVGIQIEVIA